MADLLRNHDLLLYPEGGRSYSGELKRPKTGLLHAAMQSELPGLMIVPTAISYDLVLEDHILARQGVKRSQRPFARELAEMVRYAVGYRSRAFVTFGRPIPLDGWDGQSRRDVLELGKLTTTSIGKLVKALPTSVFATAMRASNHQGISKTAPRRSSRLFRRGCKSCVSRAVMPSRKPRAARSARDRGLLIAGASACAIATCFAITRG